MRVNAFLPKTQDFNEETFGSEIPLAVKTFFSQKSINTFPFEGVEEIFCDKIVLALDLQKMLKRFFAIPKIFANKGHNINYSIMKLS
jgi:hypothetical protein